MPTDPLHPLGPREDIRGAPFHFINGTFYGRLSGAETAGGVLVLDTFRTEPGGQTHTFANVSRTGRLFIVFTPAGAMKAFFREGAERGPMSPRDFAALSAEHGMTVLGAPLI